MDNSTTIITIDQLRKETALKALNRERSTARAAYVLGISERTLVRWKKNYHIIKCQVTRDYFVAEQIKFKRYDNPRPKSEEEPQSGRL